MSAYPTTYVRVYSDGRPPVVFTPVADGRPPIRISGRQWVQEQNRVALEAICPNPAPDIYTHACHKDMNILNNEPDNLCWGTKQMYEIQCGEL